MALLCPVVCFLLPNKPILIAKLTKKRHRTILGKYFTSKLQLKNLVAGVVHSEVLSLLYLDLC